MNALKQLIKDMSAEQTKLKTERKTGSNPSSEISLKSNRVASQIRRNATKITAALNLYHELRGSPHRHGVAPGSLFCYNRDYEELSRLYSPAKT